MAKQERAVRTRYALIESAAELFSRDGFTMASLTTISSQAGVSNGALHFHFENKAALAGAVGAAAVERFDRITTDRGQESDSALRLLVETSHALFEGLRKDVVLRAGFDLSDSRECAGMVEDLHREWQTWVEEVLARADRERSLAQGVTAQEAASIVVAATVGLETLGAGDSRWLSPATLSRLWRLLLPRLAAEPLLGELSTANPPPPGPQPPHT